MTNDKRSLEYYLNLDYDLRIARVEDGEEFGYKAYAIELDQNAFYGVGRSKVQAIQSFEEVLRELIPFYWENNIPIAEPEREPEDMPSGRFVVRTSPSTHKKLNDIAKSSNQSLNAFVNAIFEQYTTAESLVAATTARIESTFKIQVRERESAWIQLSDPLTLPPYPAGEEKEHAKAANKAA